MKNALKLIIVLLIFAGFNNAFAQEKKLISGNSITVGLPIGNMASTYDIGIGIYGVVDYNFSDFLVGRFDLGWNYFSGPDATDPITGLPVEVEQQIWEFTGGLRAKLSVLYIEGRGGYFTGVDAWGVVPAIGLRFGNLDLQGNVTFAGENHWGGVRVGYYWGNK